MLLHNLIDNLYLFKKETWNILFWHYLLKYIKEVNMLYFKWLKLLADKRVSVLKDSGTDY